MKEKSTIRTDRTVDLFPDLTPIEREILFFESRREEKLKQAKHIESLKANQNK